MSFLIEVEITKKAAARKEKEDNRRKRSTEDEPPRKYKPNKKKTINLISYFKAKTTHFSEKRQDVFKLRLQRGDFPGLCMV